MTTLTMEHPQFPPDYEFGIPSIGLVKNDGTPLEVTEEQEAAFEVTYGAPLHEYYADSMVKVNSGSTQQQRQVSEAPPVSEETTNA